MNCSNPVRGAPIRRSTSPLGACRSDAARALAYSESRKLGTPSE